MTARELVLQRCPSAVASVFSPRHPPQWIIVAAYNEQRPEILGSGDTEEAAWENAARNLEVQHDA